MNMIEQFYYDQLISDINEPEDLSVAQALLLEQAKDMDAISDLLETLENVTIEPVPSPSKAAITEPRHNRLTHSEVLTSGSTN
jgi:hypothetical protein